MNHADIILHCHDGPARLPTQGQGVTRWRTEPRLVAGREGHQQKIINKMIDLLQLAKEAPGTIVAVPVGDLVEANTRLVERAVADLEQSIAERRATVYYTREQVISLLNVNPSTLWRWKERGYLVPIKVGGENRYCSKDIDRILGGGR